MYVCKWCVVCVSWWLLICSLLVYEGLLFCYVRFSPLRQSSYQLHS